MGKHLKVAYKTCSINSLPKWYQKELNKKFNVKKDDFPLRVKLSSYYFIIWSRDLPVEYSRY